MRRQLDERHVRRLADMPERTSEFVRTPHVENKQGVVLLKPRREHCGLNPRRRRPRAAKPAGKQLYGADPSMLGIHSASGMRSGMADENLGTPVRSADVRPGCRKV